MALRLGSFSQSAFEFEFEFGARLERELDLELEASVDEPIRVSSFRTVHFVASERYARRAVGSCLRKLSSAARLGSATEFGIELERG